MDERSSNGVVGRKRKRRAGGVASRPAVFIDYEACSSHNSNVPDEISEHILDLPSRVLPLVAKAEELQQVCRARIVRCVRPASYEEILRCATPAYVKYANSRVRSENTQYLDYDETTLANSDSLYWAYRAAGATIDAAQAVYDSKESTSRGFVLVRPPGHHNSCSANLEELFEVTDGPANHVWGCNGGCIFNNIACAVRALKANRSNGMRICVVDFDAHFGDGTAIQFFGEDDVFTVSLHQNQTSLFPFLTGSVEESCNSLLNIPLDEATGYGDRQVMQVLEKASLVQKIRAFEPDFIFVACGFDALESDMSSSLEFTPRLYGHLIRMLLPLCDKILCVLEGGYSRQSVDAFEEAMEALSVG